MKDIKWKHRAFLRDWLKIRGKKIGGGTSFQEIAELVESELGIDRSDLPPAERLASLYERIKLSSPFRPSHRGLRKFYQSHDWKKARYEALVRHGARCQCCGSTRRDGVSIHVDHIKPLKTDWDLRLDPENLQVLCEFCNQGKASWDQTDWR